MYDIICSWFVYHIYTPCLRVHRKKARQPLAVVGAGGWCKGGRRQKRKKKHDVFSEITLLSVFSEILRDVFSEILRDVFFGDDTP